jgi:hypothetical protein
VIEKPTSVRIAGIKDEEPLFSLLVDLHKHNSFGWGFPYRPELVVQWIERGTRPDPRERSNPEDQTRGIIGVVDGPNGLRASVGLFIVTPVWFTDALCLQELWLYVRPNERGAARLFRDLFQFSLWAHEGMKVGLDKPGYPPFVLQTGFMNDADQVERMERLWRRYSGGRKIGVLFQRG